MNDEFVELRKHTIFESYFWKWMLMRRNNMWLAFVQILKIYEVGELFEEARETLKKNVVCAIKELHIYNDL